MDSSAFGQMLLQNSATKTLPLAAVTMQCLILAKQFISFLKTKQFHLYCKNNFKKIITEITTD